MRVGLVCPYDLRSHGGVQAHVLGLARWLTAAGHETYVLAPGVIADDRWPHLGLSPHQLASTGGSVAVPYNGSVARVACGPVSSLRVRRWLAEHDLDVLHVHEPITPSAAVLAVRAAAVPVVATFHTATPGSRSLAAAGRLMGDTIGRIDEPIAVSRVAARVVEKHLGLRPRIVGNGIRLADFVATPATGPWRGGNRPRITFVGRLREPRKGLGVLLAAVPEILRRRPYVEICVAGAGAPVPAPSQVRFLGDISDTERNDLLAASDVFVAPHTGRESFGIVLLEALASGASVVASNLPAFVDLLHDADGPVGHVVEAGVAGPLAAAVVDALDHPVPAARGRALAARFDWDRIGPAVLDVYADAVAPRAVGRPTA